MRFELYNAIKKAYAEELTEGYSCWSSEHSGKLHLGIDAREDMKHLFIAPTLVGFTAFSAAFDENGACTSDDEDNIVIPFMERVEKAMQDAEDEFIAEILDRI